MKNPKTTPVGIVLPALLWAIIAMMVLILLSSLTGCVSEQQTAEAVALDLADAQAQAKAARKLPTIHIYDCDEE